MGTITLKLPDETHQRIKALAVSKKTTLNKLYEEFTLSALSEFEAENRFKELASKGDKTRGLELLKKLQNSYKDDEKE